MGDGENAVEEEEAIAGEEESESKDEGEGEEDKEISFADKDTRGDLDRKPFKSGGVTQVRAAEEVEENAAEGLEEES